MDLSKLQPKTPRKSVKRVGRGGKRGTSSGHGTKGQKSRAGASVRAGFRGGDNRIWQLFPKQRGASKKPGGGGNKSPHRRHRFFRLHQDKPEVLNLDVFNKFSDGQAVSPSILIEKGIISGSKKDVKILGEGQIKRKLNFDGFKVSKSAQDKIIKAGGKIN